MLQIWQHCRKRALLDRYQTVSHVDWALNYWNMSAGWLLINFKTQTGWQDLAFFTVLVFDFCCHFFKWWFRFIWIVYILQIVMFRNKTINPYHRINLVFSVYLLITHEVSNFKSILICCTGVPFTRFGLICVTPLYFLASGRKDKWVIIILIKNVTLS